MTGLDLETVSEVQPNLDAHIRANRVPIMRGSDEGDLNCGGCKIAIAEGVTPEQVHSRFQTEQRLIIECICGALNIIPRSGADAGPMVDSDHT